MRNLRAEVYLLAPTPEMYRLTQIRWVGKTWIGVVSLFLLFAEKKTNIHVKIWEVLLKFLINLQHWNS